MFSLEGYEKKGADKNISILFTFFVAWMAIFLNQSSVILGINISVSDFICIFVLISLIFNNRLLLPLAPTIFFLILSATLLFTAAFYVPYNYYYNPDARSILIAYFKLVVVFVYFIIGYSVSYSDTDLIKKIVKWYSIFALLIGLIGIIFTIFNIQLFSETLYLSKIRFRGLISDPNYFSIIEISALVYFSRLKNSRALYQLLYYFVISMAVLISGSKTGLITLFCYSVFRVLELIFRSRQKVRLWNVYLILVILLVSILVCFTSVIKDLSEYMASIIPAFARIQYLFTDFFSAISSSGSSRDSAWGMALELIKDSPIIGVGVGTYIGIAVSIADNGTVAHNTYLQLFSEWGIPLSMIFFTYVFYRVVKIPVYLNSDLNISLILRDIVIVFLIGSIAISLNNARMFWLFIGAMECIADTTRKKKQTLTSSGSS